MCDGRARTQAQRQFLYITLPYFLLADPQDQHQHNLHENHMGQKIRCQMIQAREASENFGDIIGSNIAGTLFVISNLY